eukprot:gene42406-51796_t
MEKFLSRPKKLNFLIVRDVNLSSAAALAEYLLPNEPQFDAILVCGPLLDREGKSVFELGVSYGDMASLLGHFENICCRVMYLPAESDPLPVIKEQANFTANSVNINARSLQLSNDLCITGYTELSEKHIADHSNKAYDEAEGLEDIEILHSLSIDIMHELLATPPSSSSSLGLFAIHYHFSHTLNHLLFHMSKELQSAQVGVLIVAPPSSAASHTGQSDSLSMAAEDATRLPKSFGGLHIVSPKSLKKGWFSVLCLEWEENTEVCVGNDQVVGADGDVHVGGKIAEGVREFGRWKVVKNTEEKFDPNPSS